MMPFTSSLETRTVTGSQSGVAGGLNGWVVVVGGGGGASVVTGGGASVVTGGGTSVVTGGGTSVVTGGGTSVVTGGGTSVVTGGGASVVTGGGTSVVTGGGVGGSGAGAAGLGRCRRRRGGRRRLRNGGGGLVHTAATGCNKQRRGHHQCLCASNTRAAPTARPSGAPRPRHDPVGLEHSHCRARPSGDDVNDRAQRGTAGDGFDDVVGDADAAVGQRLPHAAGNVCAVQGDAGQPATETGQ